MKNKYINQYEIKDKEKLVYIYTYDPDGIVVGVVKYPYSLIEKNLQRNQKMKNLTVRENICFQLAMNDEKHGLPFYAAYGKYLESSDRKLMVRIRRCGGHFSMRLA